MFETWLSATPTKTQAPFHDEFSARAFFLGQAEPAVGRKLIERWREELGLQGKTLERARDVAATADRARDLSPLVLLPFFLRRRLRQVAVDLEFVEELESAHERWAAAHTQPAEPRPRRPPVAQRARSQAPRSTPQNRPYVDGSKPANGVGGVETRLGTTACGPPTARCGGWAVRRESKSPPAVVRRVSRPAAGARL